MSTSRVFAYNTGSTINGTKQFGKIAIGVSNQDYTANPGDVTWWMGPDEELGYVISSSNLNKPNILNFHRSNYFGDSQYLDVINEVANCHNHSHFSSLEDGISWLKLSGFPMTSLILRIVGMRDTEIDFEWRNNTMIENEGFRLYGSTDGTSYSLIKTFGPNDRSYTATGLTAGNLYYCYLESYSGSTIYKSNIYDTRFKITIDTSLTGTTASNNKTFILPTIGSGTYNYYVDWGDGGGEQHITTNTSQTHVYSNTGIYQIKIRGTFPHIYFNSDNDVVKVISLDNWGNIKWNSFYFAFRGCENMIGKYVDVPNTSSVTNMGAMFYNCRAFDSPVLFDTSNVTDMSFMFTACVNFNQSVSSFITTGVTSMSYMFYICLKFNQSVSNFDTSNVTNMDHMFSGCISFNQSVSNFNTSKVTNMGSMFYSCNIFNQSVSNFDTSNVTDMNNMFNFCRFFNQSVSNFNTSKVTDMSFMFYSCYLFNQSVSNFITSGVTNMSGMFYGCNVFNQSVSNFDTSNVENMSQLFASCNKFNQDVSNFNTSKVTDMSYMFYNCTSFKQSLSSFIMTGVTSITEMLKSCNINKENSTANYDNTLISWASQELVSELTLDINNSKYSDAGSSARSSIITNYSWTINDAGHI